MGDRIIKKNKKEGKKPALINEGFFFPCVTMGCHAAASLKGRERD